MAYQYLTPKNIFKLWSKTKEHNDELTEPFPEYERIASNKPEDDTDFDITDGTSASIIQKTPKRVVQQLPTGVVETDDDNDWLPIVAGFKYRTEILPNANEDYSLFEKAQLTIERGLTFGSAVSVAPFINHDGTFSPDLTLPYWGDVYPQRGKKSGRSCRYIFIRSWWQKEDVDALIKSESDNAKQAKERGEKYKSTWDLDALKEIRDAATRKDEKASTSDEQEKGINQNAIEIVVGYQVGVRAKFYTFNPTKKKIIRTKVNKDPRGQMPADWFYGDIDGSNIFGRSIISLIGPLQNLMDRDMGAYHYNRALMLDPPRIQRGNMSNVNYAPGVLMKAVDQNAGIDVLKVDTTAITQFPEILQMLQSQLFNLVASPNSSISATNAVFGQGKTPTALNQQKATISVDDNAIRKAFEAWFEDWSETAINLYFGERSGVEVVTLDQETADKLRKLEIDGKLEEGFVNESNQIILDYDEATPALKFRVDASTSKMSDDQTKLAALELIQNSVDSSQAIQQFIMQYKPEIIASLHNRLVALSGVENPEDLTFDIKKLTEDIQQQEQQQMIQMQAQQQSEQPIQPQQPQISQEDAELMATLRQLGFDDGTIGQAIQALDDGASEAQVLQGLGIGVNNGQ